MATSGRADRPLADAAGESARHYGLRALGAAVSQVAAPILKKRGGGVLVRLKADWSAIVGAPWSQTAWPTALGRDGTLKLRVLPAAALDLQHRAPLVIERINLYFGRPVATRLVFVQGPLPLPAAPAAVPPRPLPPAAHQALDRSLAPISDPDLRDALARLGRAVITAEREAPGGPGSAPVAPEADPP